MTRKILIVEDEQNILELLAEILEGTQNYDVFLARDGLEGLELAQKQRPDLVLLDVQLPKMDGHQVCKLLKSNPETAKAKVLMITGFAQNSDRRQSMAAGADTYLSKPFTTAAILSAVDELLKTA